VTETPTLLVLELRPRELAALRPTLEFVFFNTHWFSPEPHINERAKARERCYGVGFEPRKNIDMIGLNASSTAI
jgi:hypothetical protein